MLDEGARAGFDLLGFDYRCVGYVERDAYAAAALVARMEGQALDQAPVWDDITTFNGRDWRGVVDCVVAGFPCQDLSVAGRRAGLDGARSGLFYEVLRVADDCGARLLFLENVAGIASAVASVVDETEGELSERAAARVVGELADRGWDAEWLHLRASDVGAAHRRERWFCFAWRRVADAERAERRTQRAGRNGAGEGGDGDGQTHGGAGVANQVLEHTECARRTPTAGRHEHAGRESVETGSDVADASRSGERFGQRQCATATTGSESRVEGCGEALADAARLPSGQRTGRERVLDRDPQLDDAEGERCRQGRAEHARLEGRCAAAGHGGELGLADCEDNEGGGRP